MGHISFADVQPPKPDQHDVSSRERLQAAVGSSYSVGQLVGRGGFGEVFEADEPRLSRRVAIKVVCMDAEASPEMLDRFQREARAMASLRHPNVMEVYTVGEADGLAYFVMPLVRGESLKTRIERSGALPLGDAQRILIDAASALDAAHRSGTIHRDVKPDNILLDGEAGRVLITDFGIAKALESDTSSFTRTGAFIGTPAYMSPEQAGGEHLDARSDLYSLGVVAFEMVTGRPPFQARSVQAMMAKHLTESPPAIASLRPDCPPRLARVITRCLAKDPGERWSSAETMLDALESPIGADELEPESSIPSNRAGFAPVRALRLLAIVLVGVLSVLAVTDVALGLGGISLWLGAAGVGYLAARAGRLWRDGFAWRDMLLGPDSASTTHPPRHDAEPIGADEDFGRFGSLVRTIASDRAAIVKAWAAMYHQEQSRVRALQPAVDGLVIRAKHLARKVVNLEARLAEASAKLDRPANAVLEEVDGHEPSTQARRAARVHELGAARDDAARELRACIRRLEELREQVASGDLVSPTGIDAMARSVSEVEAYLNQRAI